MANKCWRKLDTKYVPTWKKKTGDVIFINDYSGEGLSYQTVLKTGSRVADEKILKSNRTKSLALKFAKSYMKKNNTC